MCYICFFHQLCSFSSSIFVLVVTVLLCGVLNFFLFIFLKFCSAKKNDLNWATWKDTWYNWALNAILKQTNVTYLIYSLPMSVLPIDHQNTLLSRLFDQHLSVFGFRLSLFCSLSLGDRQLNLDICDGFSKQIIYTFLFRITVACSFINFWVDLWNDNLATIPLGFSSQNAHSKFQNKPQLTNSRIVEPNYQ